MRDQWATSIRWATISCFLLAVGLLIAALPVGDLMDALQARIAGLGSWAPLAYALMYGLAATLFVPGSALSLAAGVLFGLWLGTAVVWTGANIAIVLSFLIARYAARRKVEAMASTRPRFAAVDRAVGEQGWKIVALMRLSPVFPFGLQNYLFGVTAIRFLPCVLASAAFILPGTFLYVYIGFAGGEAAAAVSGAQGADTLRLALQLTGLVATLVVTVGIARIAARAVAGHAPETTALAAAETPAASQPRPAPKAVLAFVVALACLIAAGVVFKGRASLRLLLLPPEVGLAERCAGDSGSVSSDCSEFDDLLRDHVSGRTACFTARS
ncbi:MAG: TVP38/TMEM64 family protein [Acidobacteriia bacterium]|nr:TVP38/TMEM64 family protein [Terriglobia bacterium]